VVTLSACAEGADGAGAEERTTVPRLINQLRPAPLESLGSLLQRLGEANHYRERAWLGSLLGRHPARPEVLRRVRDFQTLGELTGLDREALIGLTLHRFAPWYGVAQRAPRPALPAVLPIPLWPDIGAQGNTREAPAVCPGCWGERAVILLPWWLYHLTACPRHQVLLRQQCAGCAEPLRLAAGRGDCARCGTAIAAMPARSITEDADGVEVSELLWRATGCGDGASPSAGLTLAVDHPLRRSGTPGVLRDLWDAGQALVAGDGGPRLQAREIAAVHEALVAAWRPLRDGPTRGQGLPFPLVLDSRSEECTGMPVMGDGAPTLTLSAH